MTEEQNITEEIQGIQGPDDRATISYAWRRLKIMVSTVADAPYFLYLHNLNKKFSVCDLEEIAMSLRINDPSCNNIYRQRLRRMYRKELEEVAISLRINDPRLSRPEYSREDLIREILKKQYPYPIVPMKKLALNEYRNTLEDIHRSLCLVNARRTIALNGKQDRYLTNIISFLGQACFIMESTVDSTVEWTFLVNAAMKLLQQCDLSLYNDRNEMSNTIAEEQNIADEIRRLQLVADNPTTHGNTLEDIHTSLCLINARKTIATNGEQDRDLTFSTNFVGHACFMREHMPTADWMLQVQAALKQLERLKHV